MGGFCFPFTREIIMLVTLATNQTIAATSSATYTYSPNSLQKVFINIEDADWEDCTVTVQLGSTVICNGVKMWGLTGMASLQSAISIDVSGAQGFAALDFGSHIADKNSNLYVTISTVGETEAIDVSALVDEPGKNFPVKLTAYTDNTFTSDNNLFALCYDTAEAAIDDDTTVVQVRTSLDSSAPTVVSANSWFKARTYTNSANSFGILNSHSVPLRTTYNYVTGGVMDTILTVEQMPSTNRQQIQARRSAQIAKASIGK